MIYASMVCMSGNDECHSGKFGDSSQFTNFILDYGVTCHMTPEVSGLIPESLEDTYKHIEVTDGQYGTVRQTLQVRIKMRDNNRDPCIALLHNVLLAPDLCDMLFSIITLIH